MPLHDVEPEHGLVQGRSCASQSSGPVSGKLLIRAVDEEIYSQRVGLMFDSLVGPVAADLDVWEEMAHACGHRPGELMQSKDLFKKCFDLKELVLSV